MVPTSRMRMRTRKCHVYNPWYYLISRWLTMKNFLNDMIKMWVIFEDVGGIRSLITVFSDKAMFITRFHWSIVETKEVYSRAKHAKRVIHVVLLMRVPLRLKTLISFKYLNIWTQIVDLVWQTQDPVSFGCRLELHVMAGSRGVEFSPLTISDYRNLVRSFPSIALIL